MLRVSKCILQVLVRAMDTGIAKTHRYHKLGTYVTQKEWVLFSFQANKSEGNFSSFFSDWNTAKHCVKFSS